MKDSPFIAVLKQQDKLASRDMSDGSPVFHDIQNSVCRCPQNLFIKIVSIGLQKSWNLWNINSNYSKIFSAHPVIFRIPGQCFHDSSGII